MKALAELRCKNYDLADLEEEEEDKQDDTQYQIIIWYFIKSVL